MQHKQNNQQDSKLSSKECVIIGASTGLIETTLNLPLWTIKTRAQCGLPFTRDLSVLYRGYMVGCMLSAAVTTGQVLNGSFAESLLARNNSNEKYRIMGAFIGGAVTSIAFVPVDIIATQQHKHDREFYFKSAVLTYNKLGIRGLFAGMPASCVTDGIFTSAYFGIYPTIRRRMYSLSNNEMAATCMAAFPTGFVASVLSHPFEMIKTVQQQSRDETTKNVLQCAKELYSKKNGVGFFKGFVPRTIWATSYVAASGIVADTIERHIKNKRR